MSELAAFLLARIDEDERRYARDKSEHGYGWHRMVAECEAKRGIVEELRAVTDDPERIADYDRMSGLRFAAQSLAAVYADHPDYDEAWVVARWVTARVERSGDWWAVSVPEVEGVFTQAERLDQVEAQVVDAVATMLEVDPSTVRIASVDVSE